MHYIPHTYNPRDTPQCQGPATPDLQRRTSLTKSLGVSNHKQDSTLNQKSDASGAYKRRKSISQLVSEINPTSTTPKSIYNSLNNLLHQWIQYSSNDKHNVFSVESAIFENPTSNIVSPSVATLNSTGSKTHS
jgi:hypothetical protein